MNVTSEEIDCFICRKHRGGIQIPGGTLYEDAYLRVGHIYSDTGAVYLGYLIIDLKRHAQSLADLTDEESSSLGRLLTRVSRALKDELGAEHIYSYVLGDHVPHFHMHVVPRYPNTPVEYWGFRVVSSPDAPTGGAAEIDSICEKIRDYLQRK
ncbi:HIT family protein [Paenibacillus sp. N1-5-1-14]|uniref:HIT family protein n=1 Tax=Paenibacillus radicibacter TaxID=2972488 RepID=UPI002159B462|nr:HIT family protein [Paenibacillus radicibacter]MCR8644300.1 HIT family protein [Paenibacillus radicibacter]